MNKVEGNRIGVEIRVLQSPVECQRVQLLQQRVWESSDIDLVPAHMLITITKNGGVLLGAFALDGPRETGGMVGFVLSWPGYGTDHRGQLSQKHCSHMVAVIPEYQRRGIGLALKFAQREAVLAQGITEWITWTFDPMQRINAIFNLNRLGTISNTYILDAYGNLDDAINFGLPTDRLQVDWYLRSPRVLAATSAERTEHAWPAEELHIVPAPDTKTVSHSNLSRLGVEQTNSLAVPIPHTVNPLEDARMLQWHHFLRKAMQTAYGRGYHLTNCVCLPEIGWHYILAPC